MLFVGLFKAKAGTGKEAIARRAQYQLPEGVHPVAEYWLQTPDPSVILVCEADSVAPMMVAINAWDDLFDITVIPAITAEEGLEVAQQMAQP